MLNKVRNVILDKSAGFRQQVPESGRNYPDSMFNIVPLELFLERGSGDVEQA